MHFISYKLFQNFKLQSNIFLSLITFSFGSTDGNVNTNFAMCTDRSLFFEACWLNRCVFACVCNSLACSTSISAIRSVPAHSTHDQLLLLRALNGDNEGMSKAENQVAGKRRGSSRLPYKCRAQSSMKITGSLINGRKKTMRKLPRMVWNKRFFAQKVFTVWEPVFSFKDFLT